MKSEMMSDSGLVLNRENPSIITSGGLYFDKKNFDFNIFCKYVSSFENIRFAPKSAGPQALGNFFTVDLTGGYTLKGKIPVRIYFRVRNLTDKIYSTVVGYPDFGRTIYLGMRFSFTKDRSLDQ
jgi:outer membrane receptor protein involved in Fe transport